MSLGLAEGMPVGSLQALERLFARTEDCARLHWPRVLTAFLAVLAAYYLWRYIGAPDRPGANPAYPQGWWGWFDQSEYLRAIKGFATGSIGNPWDFFYPPLYHLLAAPFWWVSRDHPPLVLDLACFLIFQGVLISVARRFYGGALPILVVAALLLFAPALAIIDWVIPWTTTLQAALSAVLIALFFRAETRPEPFVLRSRADWAAFSGFFLAYGALAPTRPLDIAIWLPFALFYFLRTGWASLQAADPRRRLATGAACLAVAAGSALVFVVFYLGSNLVIHGSLLGLYGKAATANGYFPADVVEKAFSLFRDSGTVYGLDGEALFQAYPWLAVAFAVSFVSLFVLKDVRRWILLTAFLNIAVYLPYGDFLPTGLFRYHNLHYFKWAYPWLAVIGAGQLLAWLKPAEGRVRWVPLAAALTIVLATAALDLRPTDIQRVALQRAPGTNGLLAALRRPREVEFIDLAGVDGPFSSIYLDDSVLLLDGKPLPWGSFRLVPTGEATRLVLLRPATFRTFELRPGKDVAIAPKGLEAAFSAKRVGLACALVPCVPDPPPLPVTWTDGALAFDFRTGGDLHGADTTAWWPTEDWGRWTRADRARLNLAAPPAKALAVETRARLLVGGERKQGRLALLVNGCTVAETTVKPGEPMSRVGGPVPGRCLRPDGRLAVEWRTDRTVRPVKLKLAPDPRELGVGVESLTLRRLG